MASNIANMLTSQYL